MFSVGVIVILGVCGGCVGLLPPLLFPPPPPLQAVSNIKNIAVMINPEFFICFIAFFVKLLLLINCARFRRNPAIRDLFV
jgi:hypothetical protein